MSWFAVDPRLLPEIGTVLCRTDSDDMDCKYKNVDCGDYRNRVSGGDSCAGKRILNCDNSKILVCGQGRDQRLVRIECII